MLDAALHRTYSANPGEIFYTGGAPHRFANFDARDNAQSLTVRDAFRRSVNLPFIRLMRDLVSYHVAELVGPVSPLQDPDDPRRQGYLEQFADWEGRVFLKRFYDRYRAADDPLEQLAARVGGSPARLAAVHRFVYPGPDFRRFCAWVIDHAADRPPSYLELAELFGRYWVRQMNLHDRAYVAGVHPLELWLVAHLTHHRDARLAEIAAASGDARREAYRWLFAPHRTRAQDRRIRVMLEQEAFAAIHTRWRRLGYPFDALVPSYATAIGSSGDSPAALAQLLGILLRDGLHYPTVRIERLRFAEHTPYERILRRRSPLPERVLLPDVAAAVRRELYGVVESGTGRRAARAVVLSDGAMLPVGGKTGTGDNRAYDSAVARSESSARVISRTAAFAFIVDDRFYGVVTVYVPGEEAGRHQFTSALPVQLFGHVAPSLAPLFEQGPAQIDMPRLVPKGSKRP